MDVIFALVLEVAEATKCTGEEVVAPEVGEVTVTPANAEAPARIGRSAVRMSLDNIYSPSAIEMDRRPGAAPISRHNGREASILDGLREALNGAGNTYV